MEGVTLGLRRMECMSINRILLLVAAVATAIITAIYAALISTWSGLNLACLLAFAVILLSYMFMLIRGDAMDLLA
jgi:hypothetical protein